MGTFLTSRIDLEEGMRVAAEEDRLARLNGLDSEKGSIE
jgi:hypothetical protein